MFYDLLPPPSIVTGTRLATSPPPGGPHRDSAKPFSFAADRACTSANWPSSNGSKTPNCQPRDIRFRQPKGCWTRKLGLQTFPDTIDKPSPIGTRTSPTRRVVVPPTSAYRYYWDGGTGVVHMEGRHQHEQTMPEDVDEVAPRLERSVYKVENVNTPLRIKEINKEERPWKRPIIRYLLNGREYVNKGLAEMHLAILKKSEHKKRSVRSGQPEPTQYQHYRQAVVKAQERFPLGIPPENIPSRRPVKPVPRSLILASGRRIVSRTSLHVLCCIVNYLYSGKYSYSTSTWLVV